MRLLPLFLTITACFGDFAIISDVQYGFNLTSLQVAKVYSARESYGLEDLSVESWVGFLNRMKTNATLKEIYDSHATWGS